MAITLLNDNLWEIPNALPVPLCEYLINHHETTDSFQECTMNKVVDKDYRDSHEVHIKDYNLTRMLWKMIEPHVPPKYQGRKLIGGHYRTFYLLRYRPGQQFEIHRDGHSTNSKGQKSFLTALIYLNGDCEGGQTRFYEEPAHDLNLNYTTSIDEHGSYYQATPTTGSLVLMRHYILHSAMPVISGTKYALRFNILYENFADWYTGPATDAKFEGVGANSGINIYGKTPYHSDVDCISKAWKEYTGTRRYFFLPCVHYPRGRPPAVNEDYCNNCYEILDLNCDYYTCPRCHAPVVNTERD